MKPGVYQWEAAAYHADPCPTPSLSSSIARTLISRSPRHAWTEHPRLNPNFKPEQNSEYDRGSAAHALLLEGENRMFVIEADNYRTKAAQEARDAARAMGRYPILIAEHANVLKMRDVALEAIRDCEDLSGITLQDGKAEQSIVWQEGDVWCRIRPDWMHNDRTIILDYKTTSSSAHPESWVRTMTGMGGDVQDAFYLRGNFKTGGAEDAKFLFLVQENEPPFACSFIGLPPSFLDLAESKVSHAVDTWRTCIKTNVWPGYPSRICWVDPPVYAVRQWTERADIQGIEYDPAKLWGGKEAMVNW